MFLDKDIQQIKARGINLETAKYHLNAYQQGFTPADLIAPVDKDNGLKIFKTQEISNLLSSYEALVENYVLLKFTPASGAASRMFKPLYDFANSNNKNPSTEKDDCKPFFHFWKHLKAFAFYPDLATALKKKGYTIEQVIAQQDYNRILEFLLEEQGLNYAQLPKAMIKFHYYSKDEQRTAIEEHLCEAAAYCVTAQNSSAQLHFTVSERHQNAIAALIEKVLPIYKDKFQVDFEVSFSTQKNSTDIFAVDADNQLFRLEDGKLFFRPGGHGALIENLNNLDADIIFIKNIDNVVPEQHQADTIKYKKILAAYLIKTQNKAHQYLEALENGNIEKEELSNIFAFVKEELHIQVPIYLKAAEAIEQIDWLYNSLNKPMRVCGMVRNEGEPGGGPFIVENNEGVQSFQIIETSQINMDDNEQATIANKATYFNPVDIVCAIKDYKGNKFNLLDFIDHSTGFIAKKSYKGKRIKTQELPGLWNGAMADWISLFAEVPDSTFNPVKMVNDLLREMHQ